MNDQLIRELSKAQRRIAELETQEKIPILARYEATAAQSIPNNSATQLNLETKDYDTWDACSTSGWRFTAPIAGHYWVTAHVFLAASSGWSAGELLLVQTYKNGSPYDELGLWSASSNIAISYPTSTGGITQIQLDIDDYVEIWVTQDSGGAIALSSTYDTHASVARITP